MISPTELRIGNLVYGVSDRVERVYSLQKLGLSTEFYGTIERVGYFDIKPIVPTEDWLDMFGFELSNESAWYRNYKLPNGIHISEAIKIIDNDPYGTKVGCFYMGENHTEIPSVHWLQNYVYFNYNGTELELKK